MPHMMPALMAHFEQSALRALDLVTKVETARTRLSGASDRSLLHPERLEFVYEMAFFRLYLAWEEFLEETFVRYLAGYVSANYVPVPVRGVPYSSLSSAWNGYLNGKKYKLWHDPGIVIARSRGHLVGAPHEMVINSALADLQHRAAIRHRIAHAQEHARTAFDTATIALIGRTVKASKAGRFLRLDYVAPGAGVVTPGYTWLHRLADDYISYANQIG